MAVQPVRVAAGRTNTTVSLWAERIGKQRRAKVAQIDLAPRLSEAIWHMLSRNEACAPKGATTSEEKARAEEIAVRLVGTEGVPPSLAKGFEQRDARRRRVVDERSADEQRARVERQSRLNDFLAAGLPQERAEAMAACAGHVCRDSRWLPKGV
jgi:hypothetical protein